MNKDLKAIAIFYGFIILIFWIVVLKYSLYKQELEISNIKQKQALELIEVKKVVISMDKEINVLYELIDSLNKYADEYDDYRSNIEQKEYLLKELIRNTN